MLKTETIFKKLLKISIFEWGQVFENISSDTYFRTSFVKYSLTFVNTFNLQSFSTEFIPKHNSRNLCHG